MNERESIKDLVNRIVADGKLTQAEHAQLREAMEADGEIDEEETIQIMRIFALAREGKLTVE